MDGSPYMKARQARNIFSFGQLSLIFFIFASSLQEQENTLNQNPFVGWVDSL